MAASTIMSNVLLLLAVVAMMPDMMQAKGSLANQVQASSDDADSYLRGSESHEHARSLLRRNQRSKYVDEAEGQDGEVVRGRSSRGGKPLKIVAVHVHRNDPSYESDDDEDDEEDGRRRVHRRRLHQEEDKKHTSISARFAAYLNENQEMTKRMMYVGHVERSEVVEGCRELAGGKTTFEVDVNEVTTASSVDTGDELAKTEVSHQYGCTHTQGPQVALSPEVHQGEVFGLLKFGPEKVEHLVNCEADAGECSIWALAAREEAAKIPDSEILEQGGGRKLKWGAVAGVALTIATPYIQQGIEKGVQAAKKSRCFPSDAMVQLAGGAKVAIHQLQHGDRVLAVMPNGELGYDEVYMFGHRDAKAVSQFVEIQTEVNSTLRATKDHYIHVVPASKAPASSPPTWANMIHVPAGKVQAGDYILNVEMGSAVRITQVNTVVAKGLYNPYTMAGNIVVDGHSASTHSGMSTFDAIVGTGPNVPHLYQSLLAPLRLVHRIHPKLLAYVDGLFSEDGWQRAGAGSIVRAIVQYQMGGISA